MFHSLSKVDTPSALTAWKDELKKVREEFRSFTVPKAETDYQKAFNIMKNLPSQLRNGSTDDIATVADSRRINLIRELSTCLADNTAMTLKNKNAILGWIDTLASSDDLTIDSIRNINTEFRELDAALRQSGKAGLSWSEGLKQAWDKLEKWGVKSKLTEAVGSQLRRIPETVYEIDAAMADLYKVTNETDTKYGDFLASTKASADELGRTISGLVDRTARFAKLGFSLEDSAQLAKVSTLYTNVSSADEETAAADILAAMKAFHKTAGESIAIVDSLSKLGKEFSIDPAALGEGLASSAATLALAGNDMHEALAMLAGGTELTHNASEMGDVISVLSLRIRGMKEELKELGAEYDTVGSVTDIQTRILNQTQGAVNIFDAGNNLKSTYDIIREISEVWDKISRTDQSALLKTIAGAQHEDGATALISSFRSGQVQQALTASVRSDGSAYEEQARWMDSLEAKTMRLEGAFQALSQTALDSDLMKWFVDFGTSGIQAIDSIMQGFESLNSLFGMLDTSAGGSLGALSGLLMNLMGIGEQ